MLKPALMYKNNIERKFAELLYSEEYFYYMGEALYNTIPEVAADNSDYGKIEYAIVDSKDNLLGYLKYFIYTETDTVSNFGLISFSKGNQVLGIDLFNELEKLVHRHRRIEWRMVGGNPVERHYDNFCSKYGGNKVVLHDAIKDIDGIYHDDVIYEILRVEEEE